jgi:hypothetical protein
VSATSYITFMAKPQYLWTVNATWSLSKLDVGSTGSRQWPCQHRHQSAVTTAGHTFAPSQPKTIMVVKGKDSETKALNPSAMKVASKKQVPNKGSLTSQSP